MSPRSNTYHLGEIIESDGEFYTIPLISLETGLYKIHVFRDKDNTHSTFPFESKNQGEYLKISNFSFNPPFFNGKNKFFIERPNGNRYHLEDLDIFAIDFISNGVDGIINTETSVFRKPFADTKSISFNFPLNHLVRYSIWTNAGLQLNPVSVFQPLGQGIFTVTFNFPTTGIICYTLHKL